MTDVPQEPLPPYLGGLAGARVSLVLASSTGGVGQHVRSLAAGLVRLGALVQVCGPAAAGRLFGFAELGTELAPVEIPPGRGPGDLAAVLRLRRLLRGADAVHAHGLRTGLLAGPACPRGTPYVVSWHNLVDSGRVGRLLEALIARRADVTLAASADLVARVRARGGRDVRLLEVAAPALGVPGVTVAEVRAGLGARDRPLVLAVGRLHPQKGFAVLVRAAALLATGSRPVPLVVIAGEGPEREDLTAQITALGAPVRLLGHRTDIADLLAAADLVVLPSRWEARALAAQEALRAGRPLVATAVGGLPELLGDAAVLVPPEDPTALAAALAGLLAEPAAAAALGLRGLRRAAAWPGESATVAAVAAVYAELLGSGR